MKQTIYFSLSFFLSVIFMSCGNSKDSMGENDTKQSMTEIPESLSDFHAQADDSSWILRIQFENEIYFENRATNETFKAEVDEIHVAQGADIVGLSATSNDRVLRLNIDIVDCNENGKKVDLMLRNLEDKDGENYAGCGYYRGNPRLHNIWALQAINNKKINPETFPKEPPHFELNLETKQFGGFAGCNNVFGQINFEYNKMIVRNLGSTKMYCAEVSNIENDILEIMSAEPLLYTLKDGLLILENTKGSLTLKNVD
jgi:heat shock protein HslJ